MTFYFLSDHGGRKIASGWLTYPSTRTENNIKVRIKVIDRVMVRSKVENSETNKLQLNYSLTHCDIHRSAIRFR